MVKIVDVAETPNPDALKFFVDLPLLKSGVKAFDNPESAKDDALARALFQLGPVQSVFYMDRFVTITKPSQTNWDELRPQVIETIESKAQPMAEEAPSVHEASNGASSNDDVLQKINDVLDQNIRPALAGDGGGLEILGFEDKILTVHYQGACGSCPSSTAGTLFAIQNLLQKMVDPSIQVVPG